MEEILNAIFYILAGGCAWRLTPHDLSPWSTVDYYFRTWLIEGTWMKRNQVLWEKIRTQLIKALLLQQRLVDTQSVKTTEVATEMGYDAAKLIKDHKRHILVDNLGL